jgi:hypothetical protein
MALFKGALRLEVLASRALSVGALANWSLSISVFTIRAIITEALSTWPYLRVP